MLSRTSRRLAETAKRSALGGIAMPQSALLLPWRTSMTANSNNNSSSLFHSSSSCRVSSQMRQYSDGWDEDEDLDKELDEAFKENAEGAGVQMGGGDGGAGSTGAGGTGPGEDGEDAIYLERMARPPGKYDLVTSTTVYKWSTTARLGKKVMGPLREWADEFKYRTGVHVDWDLVDAEKANSGGYDSPDDVELNVYFFGGDRAINQAQGLLQAMVKQDPAYVRLALYRTKEDGKQEWLCLRRINRELRPPDIPAITLKTPGKYTLLFENYVEAAVRTVWEETGIHVDEKNVHPTGMLDNTASQYYWRPQVRYFIAEVPEDVEVLGPQANTTSYMMGWDPKLLRQSLDPIDRTWGNLADPATGCCWLTSKQLDELQLPLKGDQYMATRYTPSPASGLADVIKF